MNNPNHPYNPNMSHVEIIGEEQLKLASQESKKAIQNPQNITYSSLAHAKGLIKSFADLINDSDFIAIQEYVAELKLQREEQDKAPPPPPNKEITDWVYSSFIKISWKSMSYASGDAVAAIYVEIDKYGTNSFEIEIQNHPKEGPFKSLDSAKAWANARLKSDGWIMLRLDGTTPNGF